MKYAILGAAYLLGAFSVAALLLLVVAKLLWAGIFAVYSVTLWLLQ